MFTRMSFKNLPSGVFGNTLIYKMMSEYTRVYNTFIQMESDCWQVYELIHCSHTHMMHVGCMLHAMRRTPNLSLYGMMDTSTA